MRRSNGDIREPQAALWYLDSNPIRAWHPAGFNRRLWRVDLRLQKLLAPKGPMAARILLRADGLKLLKGGEGGGRSTLKLLRVITLWVTLYLSPPQPPPPPHPSHRSLYLLGLNVLHHQPWKLLIVSFWQVCGFTLAGIFTLSSHHSTDGASKVKRFLDLHFLPFCPFAKCVFLKRAVLLLNNFSRIFKSFSSPHANFVLSVTMLAIPLTCYSTWNPLV